MRNWMRRVRGALGMGLTWAFASSAIGSIPRWVFGVNTDAPIPLLFGIFGFFAGVTFSAVLVIADGRRRFDQMSLPRFAAWGALGGLALSLVFAKVAVGWKEILLIAPSFALASAVCAASSLALARRAVRGELPNASSDATASELRTDSQRELLADGDSSA